MDKNYVETDCIFSFRGKSYESGGAYIVNGKGIMYAYEAEKKIGNWHGDIKIPCRYGREYRSNFGDKRQTVYFRMDNKNYIGTYYKSNSDIVRVRAIK